MQIGLIAGLLVQRGRRQRAEARVQESERRYRLATNAAMVGVWDWNLETNDIYIDPPLKHLLGYEDHEIPNRLDAWGQLVHPDDRQAVDMFARMHIGGALPLFELEHRMLHKDGSIRWFLVRGAVTAREGETPVQMIGTDMDVTHHKLEQEALRESEARAHALAGRLISAQEAERSRIARELHDDASQRIAVLAIGLGMAMRDLDKSPVRLRGELQRLQEQTERLGEHIRHFSHSLHPGVLQRAGLIAALRQHCNDMSEQQGLYVDFHATDVDLVPADAALCLYRVAQETFHNIAKHAYATRVEVELRRANGLLEMTISDDGLGFDPAKLRTGGGLGLISLEERVRYLHGTLTIEAGVKGGTRVRVRLPGEGGHDAAHATAPC